MKIVDRKTFIQMPEGTVFCKIDKSTKDKHPFALIREMAVMNDVSDKHIGCTYIGQKFNNSGTFSEEEEEREMATMIEETGYEVDIFPEYGWQEPMSQDENIVYAIFSRAEVEEVIDLLQQALRDGYKEATN